MENNNRTSLNTLLFYKLIFVFIIFSYSRHTNAQNTLDTINTYFNTLQQIPQEKLYLHIDKPFYGAGEKIWFKGYLVNGSTHKNDAKSNFFITELISRQDSVIMRKKIPRDSIEFAGHFDLPPELPQGDYYLRGYSNWMLNSDPDFFYNRPIKIGNSIDLDVISTIQYEKEENTYKAIIRFTDQNNMPLEKIKIRSTLYDKNKVIKRSNFTTNADGSIWVPLPDLENNNNNRILEIEFNDNVLKYQRSFFLPNRSTDFHVTFFPEGGDLLNLPFQRVAFKVQKANGFSGSASGTIVNQQGEVITSLKTEHDGMGVTSFRPETGVTYFADITSEEGITKRFPLPEVKATGFSISVYQHRKDILYQIQATETTNWPSTLFLIAHTRGKMCIAQEVSPTKMTGKIPETFLDEGITHFLLVDDNGTPLTERLCFVRHTQQPQWEMVANKDKYEKREKVILQVKGRDKYGEPLSGDFSVSITDAGSVVPDSLADNILSNLLLTSDLKGYIENPGYYFLSQDMTTRNYLDLVMLTHGWRRFNLDNLKSPIIYKPQHFIERGQYISGRIKGLFGGKVKKGPIVAIAPKHNIFETVETDENGEFSMDINFPDSTLFIIQARTKRGFAGVDILVDSSSFANPAHNFPFTEEPIRFMDDYLINTREKYYYEGGMRVINMKEVVVRGQSRQNSNRSFLGGSSGQVITEEELERYAGQSIYSILGRLPGVMVTGGNEVRIRNSSTPPSVVIDGVLYNDDNSILDMITVTDIEEIEVLKDASASIYGSMGAGGIIAITTKRGFVTQAKPTPGIISFTPLGYSKAIEFYHPTYETPAEKKNAKPDLRTTLYWNPSLTFDSKGKTTIEYYTSDNSVTQNIVIEGVDEEGNICRYTGKVGY